jgi:shikimate kinase
VIAAGGGAILDPRNRELLKRSGMVLCLEARPETVYERLLEDTEYSPNPVVRPLLAGPEVLERIKSLKASRQPHYAIAHRTVRTDELSLEEVSQEIVRHWQSWSHDQDE